MSKLNNNLTNDKNVELDINEAKFELTAEMKLQLENTDVSEIVSHPAFNEVVSYITHRFKDYHTPTTDFFDAQNDEDREMVIDWFNTIFNLQEEIPSDLLKLLSNHSGESLKDLLSYFPDRESLKSLNRVISIQIQ